MSVLLRAGIIASSFRSGGGSGEGSWSLAGATYDNVSFSIAAQQDDSRSVRFKPDGAKMYVVGNQGQFVHQYTLSSAWELSTATYDDVSVDVSAENSSGNVSGMFLKPDGTKMYLLNGTIDLVFQYTLSSAWDVSSATYDNVSFSVFGQDDSSRDLFFKEDGTKLYVIGSGSDSIHQYTLTAAWDISSATYDSAQLDVSGEQLVPNDLCFKPDGTRVFIVGATKDGLFSGTAHQYSLSTAWDVSSGSYDGVFLDVDAQATQPSGLNVKPDGTKMYIIAGLNTDQVFQYSL